MNRAMDELGDLEHFGRRVSHQFSPHSCSLGAGTITDSAIVAVGPAGVKILPTVRLARSRWLL